MIPAAGPSPYLGGSPMSLGIPRLAWAAGAFMVWRLARSAPSSRWGGRLCPSGNGPGEIPHGRGEVAGSSRRPRADEAAPRENPLASVWQNTRELASLGVYVAVHAPH